VKARIACKTTVEEIEDEFWAEERKRPKSNLHVLYQEGDKESLDSDIANERPAPSKHPTRQTIIEEVEDETWEAHRRKPKSLQHILEPMDDIDDSPALQDKLPGQSHSAVEVSKPKQTLESEKHPTRSEIGQPPGTTLPPPPKTEKPYRLPKKRFTPAGESALGVSVLSAKGWVGNLENGMVNLRMDSCVDVMLISEEFFKSLKGAPKERQGMRMQLWQLTDKDSNLKGFVRIPILMESEEGILLELEAEAYIVPGMTVPILLGEDYQLNYEIGVTRNVEKGSRIHFGGTDYKVLAQRVNWMTDFDRMRQSAMLAGHFIRSKLHQRARAKRHR